MSKDVNIHVKTTGVPETADDLKAVGRSAEHVGDSVQTMGDKAQSGSSRFINGIKNIIGPLGFMAVLSIVGKAAGAISSFFDTLKNRCDEAVQKVSEVRAAFATLFEVMNAFDEKSKKQVSKETAELLKETSVSAKIGVPIIAEYARQFKPAVEQGEITDKQYQQGLRDMLGYGERHGQEATPELITLMGGMGMTTPEQQGAFRRQITGLSGKTGLEDKDVIETLGRSMPTIKAMNWSPEQALSVVGTVAQGEIGRAKTTLPAATLEALVNPNTADLKKKYGISPESASDAQSLFNQVALKSQNMNGQAKLEMLQGIYGAAAPGISKLIASPQGELIESLRQAAGPKGEQAEAVEEAGSRSTMERINAQKDAQLMLEKLKNSTPPMEYKKRVREIGEEKREAYRIKQPLRQKLREAVLSDSEEKESAAMRSWWESLSKEEQETILNTYKSNKSYWDSRTPEEQYNMLLDEDNNAQSAKSSPGPSTVNIHYSNDMHFHPSTAQIDLVRTDRDFK